jgi:deoxyribodipyrimidine photo-lyase
MSPPPTKKSKSVNSESSSIGSDLHEARIKVAESVDHFKFNMKRSKLLTGNEGYLHREAKGVAYWMHRDQRLQDNWAALFAQKLALADNIPLYVIAGISVSHPEHAEATRRMLDFSLDGLKEVAEECDKLGIEFHLLQDTDKPMSQRILDWIKKAQVGCVVADFSPLRPHRGQLEALQTGMAKLAGPCLYQVDAHNVVPIWIASEKQEYAARTIRPKIMNKLSEFLTGFPPLIHHPVKPSCSTTDKIDWCLVKKNVQVDESVGNVEWSQPGTRNGYKMLESFVKTRLRLYGDKRNDPNVKALSYLSPWFHYGQLGVQRAVLYMKKNSGSSHKEAVATFVEEAVVRSELSDNFCYYNKDNYDSLEGGYAWAVKTLKVVLMYRKLSLSIIDNFAIFWVIKLSVFVAKIIDNSR